MPANGSDAAILIVSLAGRALAASAKRGGRRSQVIDLFNDLDTQSLCEGCERVPPRGYGFEPEALLSAADKLDPEARCGVVYGSGFEAQPLLLQALCERRPLLGNEPATVGELKHPVRLAALLARLGIAHPDIRLERPNEPNWLAKRVGACGGGHVRWRGEGDYYQRYVEGQLLSLTVLSDGVTAHVLGYCRQWCADDVPERPFSYGGAVSLPSAGLRREFAEAAQALTEAAGLRGLWNVDLIADDERWWLIEINPRPGATFELHETATGLVAQHIDRVLARRNLPIAGQSSTGERAHCVVYAPRPLSVPDWTWPPWTSDRPCPGTLIDVRQPVCMVHARSSTADAARSKLTRYRNQIQRTLQQWHTPN